MSSDSYTMTVTFQDVPGWRRPNISITADVSIIAAALKQLCDFPSAALSGLDKLEVKRS